MSNQEMREYQGAQAARITRDWERSGCTESLDDFALRWVMRNAASFRAGWRRQGWWATLANVLVSAAVTEATGMAG